MIYLKSENGEDFGVLMYDKIFPRSGDYIEKEGKVLKVLSLRFDDDNGRVTITVESSNHIDTSVLPLKGEDKEKFEAYLKDGDILGAVKFLKGKTGYGLRECKDITTTYRNKVLNLR